MAFSVSMAGGFLDIPDSVWAAGTEAIEDHLVALNSLVRYAATCDEYIESAPQANGGAVALPQSGDDGYKYSRSELLYAFALAASPNPGTGINGGAGNILYINDYVEQDTGVVSSAINYYIQGGQDAQSSDGLTAVLCLCRRGAGLPAAPNVGTGGGTAGGGGVQTTRQSNAGDPRFPSGLIPATNPVGRK